MLLLPWRLWIIHMTHDWSTRQSNTFFHGAFIPAHILPPLAWLAIVTASTTRACSAGLSPPVCDNSELPMSAAGGQEGKPGAAAAAVEQGSRVVNTHMAITVTVAALDRR